MDEKTDDQHLNFNGVKIEDIEEQPSNDSYDLTLTKPIHITQEGWEIEVHNMSKNSSWNGNIIIKVISKEVMDLYDKAAKEGVSFWYFLRNENAGLDDGPNYKTSANSHVHLDKNEYKKLTLDIIDLPDREDDEYYVCIYSKKDETEVMKDLAWHQNPQTITFKPSDYLEYQNDFDLYVKDYKEIMSYIKLMSKWGDPFALEVNTYGNRLDEIINNLGKGSIDVDGLGKDFVVNSTHLTGMMLQCFLKDIHKTVKQTAKTAKDVMKPVDCIREVYETLRGFYAANQVDDNHKFFETAKQIMKLSDKIKIGGYKYFPALDVYRSYLDLGDAMVRAIDRIEVSIHGDMVFKKLVDEKSIFKIKVRKYTSDGSIQYFSPREVYQQIRSVDITITTEQPGYKAESKPSDPDLSSSQEIIFKNVDFHDSGNTLYTTPEAWMTITWNNNRVTHVPLLDKQFVKLENFKNSDLKKEDVPIIMTVELQSGTYWQERSIPNQLTFIKP